MAVKFQLGKNKLTGTFIDAVRKSFKRHKIVKISLLPSYSRDKEIIRSDAEKICKELSSDGKTYKHRLIGYTLIILQR